jgi:hypothetical protein
MYSNNIPVNAYVFIGLASVVMAVVTIMDSNSNDTKEPETPSNDVSSSVTEMLPAFSNPFSSNPNTGVTEQPATEQGNTLSNMFYSENNAAQPYVPETTNKNDFNLFGDMANSDEGLAKEAPPVDNPFQQLAQAEPIQAQPIQVAPVQTQPVQAQPVAFGGNKYNKTNKHKSKRNKKTKNHRKK